jgi:hypothetical protein
MAARISLFVIFKAPFYDIPISRAPFCEIGVLDLTFSDFQGPISDIGVVDLVISELRVRFGWDC